MWKRDDEGRVHAGSTYTTTGYDVSGIVERAKYNHFQVPTAPSLPSLLFGNLLKNGIIARVAANLKHT